MFLIVEREWPWSPRMRFNLDGLESERMKRGLNLVFNTTTQTFYDWTKESWVPLEIADKDDPELEGSGIYDKFFRKNPTTQNDHHREEPNQDQGVCDTGISQLERLRRS